MAVRHIQHTDNPIVFTIVSETVSIEEVKACCAMIDNYLQTYKVPMVYWIIDALDFSMSHSDAIEVVEMTKNKAPGSGGDARVVPLVVICDQDWAYFMEEARNRYFEMQFPVFDTPYEAHLFALHLSQLQNE